MITAYPINFVSDSGGGGGGDTDFSIANVKVDNQALGGSADVITAFAFDENELAQGAPAFSYTSYTLMSNAEKTFKVIMYKGCAFLVIDGVFRVSYDGDIEESNFGYLVTGDGTLTIYDDGGAN